MTTLKTSKVKINGKVITVNQVKGNGKQDIYYQVNGNKMISADKFWKMKPIFIK